MPCDQTKIYLLIMFREEMHRGYDAVHHVHVGVEVSKSSL